MMSESVWDICMWVSPSACCVFVLVDVCICVCLVHSALCVECFSCMHQYFCGRVEFCKNIFAGGTGSQLSSWRTHLLRNTKIHADMQTPCLGNILGPPGWENVASPCCLCTWERIFSLHVCRCAGVRVRGDYVMRWGTSVSQWASLKADQQRQTLPTRVRSHVCSCTLKPSKCSRLWRDPSTWLKHHTSSVSICLLLLSFCLTLSHKFFHLILSTASSISQPILASVTFHLFLSFC